MSKIDALIEQTVFLLDHQKQSQQECQAIFDDFIASIKKHIKDAQKKQDLDSLDRVLNIVMQQSEELQQEIVQDIEFMQEQFEALKKVKLVQDPQEAREMLALMIDEDDILDTDEFKKSVEEDRVLSKKNLESMIDDLKGALEEGGAREVELLLEALFLGSTGSEEDEFYDMDDDCCGESSCSSCSGCSSSCCDEKEDVDIFESFNDFVKKEESKKSK